MGKPDLIFEATGNAEICFRSMEVLAHNGALIWTSITGGKHEVTLDAAKINLEWVLGNKLLVSSVNGNRRHFELGIQALSHGELTYPGVTERILTHPVAGLDSYKEMMRLLEEKEALKVFVNVAGELGDSVEPSVRSRSISPIAAVADNDGGSMSSLNIRKDPCELDFLALGALDPPARSGRDPVPEGAFGRDPRFRRRVQRRRRAVGLLRAEDRHRDGDGQLPDRRAGPVAGARDGRHAVSTSGSSTTACAGRTSPRCTATAATESARRWSSTTGPTRPVPCSSRATSTGPGSSPAACAGSIPGASSRRCRETTAPLIIEGMQAARAAGAITSFDLNYRAKLWASVGGAERGQQVIKKIAGQLDALFGNEEDLQKGLGIAGPEVDRQVEARSRHVLQR